MRLGAAQEAFFEADLKLRLYIFHVVCPKYRVTVREGEGRVALLRKARGGAGTFYDGEHIAGSTHYVGLARHYLFFDERGEFIANAKHPAYRDAGSFWEKCHELARWGGNWDKDETPYEPRENDGVHFSFAWEGKA